MIAAQTGGGQTSPTLPAGEPTLLRRCGAAVYEAFLLAALLIAAGFAILPVVSPSLAGPYSASRLYLLPATSSAFLLLYYFIVAGVYCIGFWSDGRRTLPMKTWRLALVAVNGTSVDRWLAGKRYLGAWIGPIAGLGGYVLVGRWGLIAGLVNYLWAVVDGNRRFLHDRLAGTRLIQR